MDHSLIDAQLRAISDPTRRAILSQLSEGNESSAGAVAAKFEITRPAVSRHLRLLLEAELVVMRKHAQSRLYSANTKRIHFLRSWFDAYWDGALLKLKAAVENEVND